MSLHRCTWCPRMRAHDAGPRLRNSTRLRRPMPCNGAEPLRISDSLMPVAPSPVATGDAMEDDGVVVRGHRDGFGESKALRNSGRDDVIEIAHAPLRILAAQALVEGGVGRSRVYAAAL